MCVFFWRNLRENYLKKHFFLVKSIDLEIFPLRKSSIRFINSGERRCWFISTKENLFLFGKATVHFGVKIILKDIYLACQKKSWGHLKTNFILSGQNHLFWCKNYFKCKESCAYYSNQNGSFMKIFDIFNQQYYARNCSNSFARNFFKMNVYILF